MIYLPAILLILASACNGIMDLLSFRFHNSVFNGLNNKFWNPSISWGNKWKNRDIKQGERFWGSSRWFVKFTDGWHLIKSFMILFILLAVFIIPFINDIPN